MSIDRELEEIKRRRMAQIQEHQMQSAEKSDLYSQEQAKSELEAKKQEIMRQILTTEARERLTTLKMSRPMLVEQIEYKLISMAQSGQIQSMIDDFQLKQLLSRIQPKKRETTIKRI